MPKRWCADCKGLYDIDSAPGLRCPACQAAATARRNARPSSSSRGLGWAMTRRKQSSAPDAIAYRQATACQCPGQPLTRCQLHRGVCGEPFTAANPKTAGHTLARSQGGSQSPIMAVCRRCNSSDGGRLAHG